MIIPCRITGRKQVNVADICHVLPLNGKIRFGWTCELVKTRFNNFRSRHSCLAKGPMYCRLALTLICAFTFTSCIGAFKQWGDETSIAWKAPTFDPLLLERQPVVVLNALTGMGMEGYRHQVSQSLFLTLTQEKNPLIVLSPQETIGRLNGAGLGKEVSSMTSDYFTSGILDRDTLQKICQTLECQYVLQPSLGSFRQYMEDRLRFFGLRIFQTRVTTLRLSLQIWDAHTGEIVWESSGEGTMAAEDVRDVMIPFEDIAKKLWLKILSDLWPPEPLEQPLEKL